MNNDNRPFLNAVKNELGKRLLPALPEGMAQQLAKCSFHLLNKLITTAEHWPTIQAQAMGSYAPLLNEIAETVGENTVTTLRQALQNNNYSEVEVAVQSVAAALAADNSPEAANLLHRILTIETTAKKSLIAAFNQELEQAQASAEPPVFSTQQQQDLTAYLRQQFPDNDQLELGNIKAVPGGFSKQTIFVSLHAANNLPDTLVIRVDRAESPVGSTVTDEFTIIKTLYDAGVAVPKPYALESDGKVLGGAFIVVGKIPGSNAGDAIDVHNGSEALAVDIARKLAAMHRVPVANFGPAVHGANTSTTERLLQEIKGFEQQWRSFNRPSIALETAFVWLQQNIHLADGPRCLIHKDVGCHNMLCENDEVTALLDWETAAIGHAAQDLGYVKKTIVQMGDWETFMAAYRATGAPAPGADQIEYYALWGYVWLNVMLLAADMAFRTGATDDIQLGYAGNCLGMHLQSQLAEELLKVLGNQTIQPQQNNKLTQ